MPKDIGAIMSPRSIAVVGATNRPGSVGLAVFRNILEGGFQGVLYPVNPNATAVQSIRAYPRLADIPDEVDLAVIIVPAGTVAQIMEEAGRKGVKAVVVITAGFKEVGGDGIEMENRLKEIAARYGVRMVGPNCLGVINTNETVRMNASFATKMPKPGNIAFISQSPLHSGPGPCGGKKHRVFEIHQFRKQGRRERGRPPPLSQGGSGHQCDPHVFGEHNKRPGVP